MSRAWRIILYAAFVYVYARHETFSTKTKVAKGATSLSGRVVPPAAHRSHILYYNIIMYDSAHEYYCKNTVLAHAPQDCESEYVINRNNNCNHFFLADRCS